MGILLISPNFVHLFCFARFCVFFLMETLVGRRFRVTITANGRVKLRLFTIENKLIQKKNSPKQILWMKII